MSELDSKLFVIPENWHKKRILKGHIRSESEATCHPEELKPTSVLRLSFTIAGLGMTVGCTYVIYSRMHICNIHKTCKIKFGILKDKQKLEIHYKI